MLVFLWAALSFAASPADAGLPVQVDGDVTCSPAGGSPAPVVPFMKLRVGDQIGLAAGSTIELVFFGSGRREAWTGPASFVIGEASATPTSGSAARVVEAGASVGEQLRLVPSLLASGPDRAGQTVVRGDPPGSVPLSASEQAEIDAARAAFDQARATAAAEDVLPDLLLWSTLRTYGLEADAAKVIEAARARCASCDLP